MSASKNLAKLTTPIVQRSTVHAASLGHESKSRDLNISRDYPTCVHKTKVQICGKLYQEFKERGYKRYRDAPEQGIKAEAEYFDNKKVVRNSKGITALLLHGSPGTFNHYSSLIGHLTGLGVRVIAPNLPTMDLTKVERHFRHSPEERVEFIKAILERCEVDDIDVIASHSSGTFASVRLWKQPDIKVRAFCFFNPLGYETTVPMQPDWFSRLYVKIWQEPMLRGLQEKLGVALMKMMGNPFAEKNAIESVVQGACCLHYNNQKEFKGILEEMAKAKVPQLMVLSDNDKVMTKKMNANLLHTCGTSAEDATIYDKNGKLERVGVYNDRIKVIRTRLGGHFSFIKYPELVNPAMSDLLARVAVKRSKTATNSIPELVVDPTSEEVTAKNAAEDPLNVQLQSAKLVGL